MDRAIDRKDQPPPSNYIQPSLNRPSPIHFDEELPSLQEAFEPIHQANPPADSDSSPNQKDQPQPTSTAKHSKSARRILESDEEDVQQDSSDQPKQKTRKFKKLKGLSKKDKEEAQRVIAACERKKNVRLAASCRAPLTRLGDIVNKATRPIESPPDHPSFSKSYTFNALSIESKRKTEKDRQVTQPPTNSLVDFTETDDDGLPNVDELMSTSNPQARLPASEARNNDKNLDPEEALRKKEWLRNQRQIVLEPDSSAPQEEPVETIDSDSDLDIVQQPSRPATTKHDVPRVPNDPFEQRLYKSGSHSKLTTQPLPPAKKSVLEAISNPLFPPSHKSLKKTNGKKLDKLKEVDLLQGLLAKSAVEGALIREQKRNEFIERGGKLANVHTATSSSEIQHVNLKSILKTDNSLNVEEEEEEDIECDWDEELSGNEEVEQVEGNEDEIEDSQGEEVDGEDDLDTFNDTTIRPGEEPNGLKTSNRNNSPNTHSKISSSKFPSKSIPPAHQLDYKSTILAPDSNSTDQHSSRTSSKPSVSVSDSSEPDNQPINPSFLSSPIQLPGFNAKQSSQPILQDLPSINHQNCVSSPTSSVGNSIPLPGFKSVNQSKTTGPSDTLGDGFSQIEGFNIEPKFGKIKSSEKNQQSGFSQFFTEGEGEGKGFNFTHPPPLLKSKIGQIHTADEDNQEDLDDEISATCILPAVEALPEEKERDLVLMVLGAQNTSMEDDDGPMEYVNRRGFLTQHKPVNELNGPPDSPMMSQDPISRTPFALRKGKSRAVESDPARLMEKDEINSPPKTQNNDPRESTDYNMHSPTPTMTKLTQPKPENAFTKIMQGQKAPPPKSPRLPSGKGKMFLADEADESEDEYKGLGDEEEEGSETEETKKLLQELVDDREDNRDEKSKLEDRMALEDLAKQHRDQHDQKVADQIQKVINGKLRVQKARHNRAGNGAISDSDSEDDAEMIAIKRAQAFDAKKKKKAIDLLANKHQSFFKSYQEGTSQWVDEEDTEYLQPPEDNDDNQNEDYDSNEDDEDQCEEEEEEEEESLDDMVQMGSELHHHHKERKEKRTAISTSPPITSDAHQLPFKVNDQFCLTTKSSKNPIRSPTTTNSNHHDLDKMYDGLKSTKNLLTAHQKQLVITELGAGEINNSKKLEGEKMGEGRKNSGNHNHMKNNKSSSITYQQQQHHRKLNASTVKKTKDTVEKSTGLVAPSAVSHNRLSKLKNKK